MRYKVEFQEANNAVILRFENGWIEVIALDTLPADPTDAKTYIEECAKAAEARFVEEEVAENAEAFRIEAVVTALAPLKADFVDKTFEIAADGKVSVVVIEAAPVAEEPIL